MYVDQQIPAEEPQDPKDSKVVQEMFARRSPTLEDEFFLGREQQRRRSESNRPPEPPPIRRAADRPNSVWQKIYRAFARRFDTNWRP